ncbi:MAG: hypothetical protein AAF628_12900 [Planctomycetota bacterium]
MIRNVIAAAAALGLVAYALLPNNNVVVQHPEGAAPGSITETRTYDRLLDSAQDLLRKPTTPVESGATEEDEAVAIWNPISVSLSSGCTGSVCIASGCLGSGCAGSGCLGSGCLGSACTNSGCLGSGCINSGCLGSLCVKSTCLGSACPKGCGTKVEPKSVYQFEGSTRVSSLNLVGDWYERLG